MTTEALTSPIPQVRPEAPRRAWSMALPYLVAVAIGVAGALLTLPTLGIGWGALVAAGVLVGLWLGKVQLGTTDRVVLAVGLVASGVLAYLMMPEVPEDVDVATSLRFAGAWIPAAVASWAVISRRGATPTVGLNSAFAWLLAGAFALPAAETVGVLRPLSSLRRGAEPVFGAGDYAAAGVFVLGVGIAALYAALTRLPALAISASVVLFTAFSAFATGFDVGLIVGNFSNIDLSGFWPPEWDWAIGETGTWWWPPSWEFGAPQLPNPLMETIRIAIVSSVIGCGIALPLGFLASTLTAPNKPTYLIAKGFLNLIRTMPDLFWAVIFVGAVGTNAFAGTLAMIAFSLAIMAKLFSETVDDAKPGPLEAARATGARHFPAVRAAVLPQVLPAYVAYALYVFELNLRASAIIGLVGAGGIGRVLEAQRAFYQYDRIVAIVIVVTIIVFILERISVWLRRRLT